MAGDWLKIDVTLPKKPEVWQIAGMLGMAPEEVVGRLIKVWAWFDAHTQNGHAPGVTFVLVDAEAGVTGFAEAMALVGWLEQKDRTLVLPNFDRHNGKTAKNRALSRDRKAASRANVPENVSELSRKERDKNGPREEKRREEREEDSAAPAAQPPDKPGARPACPQQAIVALYHETLPELRRVREWNDTRQKLLARRWAESPERQTLDWWRAFFGYVRRSRFLMGQTTGRDGRPFDCDLEWLVRPTNFAKVVEGKYEDQAA